MNLIRIRFYVFKKNTFENVYNLSLVNFQFDLNPKIDIIKKFIKCK